VSRDVRHWLQAEGFGQYADVFEARQIDAQALALLTEEHLKELGIPLGPRVRLLAAIARHAQSPAPERRRLTVMFADLVGSTALSTRLDPEELRDLLREYQNAVAEEVARFGAYVARYLGDGALVYFGYPRAHEDDAERAVRAGLGIGRAVAALRAPGGEPLQVRIGIATGLVVVGDVLVAGAATERTVLGETPNIAARLQALAAPGEIVVSADTRALTGKLFDWRDLGALDLKGLSDPHPASVLLAERSVASRFEARGGRLARMVGRDRELGDLLRLWRRAAEGRGQLVLLRGEAGIGKSRLVRALSSVLGDEPHVRITNQCSPYHVDSALHPMAQQLARAAGHDPSQSSDDQLRRLEALLEGAEPTDVALIASLLGLDASRRYAKPDLTPEQQRARTFDALLNQVLRMARRQPVLWVLEDAHWADPTTLDLVSMCVERIAGAPVLAVVTARPEFMRAAGEWPHASALSLARLPRAQVASLVEEVARGRALPAAVVDEIVARCDGVPLYVEEVTKAVLDAGIADVHPLPRLSVPASLHDSMMARLDRHPELKQVAQVAACLGREFSRELLAGLCGLPEATLADRLERLEQVELVFRRGGANAGRYIFKHALVRDAAYESLLKSRRQEIHGRILEALERSPDAAPELLAQHATLAGRREQAIGWWRRAGVAAIARPAYREAISHVNQALRLAEAMEDTPQWRERRLELTLLLGQAMIPLRGYSHSETLGVFRCAQALVDSIPQGPHRFSVSFAMWVAHYVRGEHTLALDIAHDMLERARSEGSDGRTLSALRALGIGQMITGQLGSARASFEQAQDLAWVVRAQSREVRMAVAQRFGADPDIATQFHMALTDWALGEVDRACETTQRAVDAARALGHVHTLGHALAHGAIFAAVMRDGPRTRELSAEAIAFADEHDMDLWRGYGSIMHGYALVLADDCAEGARVMGRGFQLLQHTETGAMVSSYHAVQAYALAAQGRLDDAAREADLVQRELSSGSERYHWVEALRWLGAYRALLPSAAAQEVEDAYVQALRIAREMGARSLELAAAASLADFWAQRGRNEEAVSLLTPLLCAFEQGRDTPGPRQAAQLLRTLGARETITASRVSNPV
jgi:class 3 adenylate cyclase/tetratricopeptide (TPR) repeat protein